MSGQEHTEHQEQRQQPRQAVRWPAHVSGSTVRWLGVEACDVSQRGLFIKGAESSDLPPVGSSLYLTVFPRGWGYGVESFGVVKWRGRSNDHDCDGIGIELDDVNSGEKLLREVGRGTAG